LLFDIDVGEILFVHRVHRRRQFSAAARLFLSGSCGGGTEDDDGARGRLGVVEFVRVYVDVALTFHVGRLGPKTAADATHPAGEERRGRPLRGTMLLLLLLVLLLLVMM